MQNCLHFTKFNKKYESFITATCANTKCNAQHTRLSCLRSSRDVFVVTACTRLAIPVYLQPLYLWLSAEFASRHNRSLKPGITKCLLLNLLFVLHLWMERRCILLPYNRNENHLAKVKSCNSVLHFFFLCECVHWAALHPSKNSSFFFHGIFIDRKACGKKKRFFFFFFSPSFLLHWSHVTGLSSMSLWPSDIAKCFLSHKTQGKKNWSKSTLTYIPGGDESLHYFFIYFYYTWHAGMQALLWTEAKYKQADLPLLSCWREDNCEKLETSCRGEFSDI